MRVFVMFVAGQVTMELVPYVGATHPVDTSIAELVTLKIAQLAPMLQSEW